MSTFEEAIENNLDGLIGVLDIAKQIWEPCDVVKWLKTEQPRFRNRSPLAVIASEGADAVIDLVENIEMYS